MLKRLLPLLAFACAVPATAVAADATLFISPCGKPYLAEAGQPYPIGVWFKEADKNADGRLDAAEMRADADAFFTELDRNKDDLITSPEVRIYEVYMVPEILGVSALDALPLNQRSGFMRAQYGGGDIVPNSAPSGLKPRQRLNTTQGAVQFSLFREPQPIRAADRNLDYRITRQEFAAHADRHFQALDADGDGVVALADLPETPAERAAGGKRRR